VKIPELNGDRDRGSEDLLLQCALATVRKALEILPRFPRCGANAYDEGRAMNDIAKMAAFVQHNMPKTDPDSLTRKKPTTWPHT